MRLPKVEFICTQLHNRRKYYIKEIKMFFTVLITSKFLVMSFLFYFDFKKGTILQYPWLIIHKNLCAKRDARCFTRAFKKGKMKEIFLSLKKEFHVGKKGWEESWAYLTSLFCFITFISFFTAFPGAKHNHNYFKNQLII